jgi:hypothetical protein
MSKRKSHHYVSRFYLKRFSVNEEGKSIGLYNCKNQKYISNAPIKHQACKDFLYGTDDETESELAKLETGIATLFHYWTDEKILIPPPKDSNAFSGLKRFILYQLYRIPKAGNDSLKRINDSFNAILPIIKPDMVKNFDGLRISHEDPVLLTLVHSADKEFLLDFLDCKFVVNLSELLFITSDSPVILYNQFMEKSGMYVGATGLPIKGLQIFYPIHPRLMICLYDSNVYSCGENENCTSTESVEDVHLLNVLQYLNCGEQLFFDDNISEKYITESIIKEYRNKKVPVEYINETIRTPDNKTLFFMSSEDAHIDLDLSFFKITCEVSNYKSKIAPLRHPSLDRKS